MKIKLVIFLAFGLFARGENPEITYPKCNPHSWDCKAGKPAPSGSCKPQGLYCIEGDSFCTNNGSLTWEEKTDANCQGPEQVSSPCSVREQEYTVGRCQQSCSWFGTPLTGTCGCEFTGVVDNSTWTSRWIKVCN